MIHVYMRVSSKKQDTRSQELELKEWSAGRKVQWHKDTFTGKTLQRPGWEKLTAALQPGDTVVVWRLDRLGRTCKGLSALFDQFHRDKITLVSLKEGIDLSKPAGRMIANVLASVAQFETELRVERVLAGQAAARKAGKTWGGRKVGTRIKVTEEKERTIKQLHHGGESISAIARQTGVSRPTVYKTLGLAPQP